MTSSTGWVRGVFYVAITIAVGACAPAEDETGAGGATQQPVGTGEQGAGIMPGAGKEPGQTPPEPSEGVAAVEALAMARHLAEYGERTQSPMALLASAQILMSTPTQPLEGDPESQTDATAAEPEREKTDTTGVRLDPVQLLARAESLAGDNEHVRALVEQLRGRAQAAPRGATGGARQGFYRVNAESTNTHTVTFQGNEPALVCIDGDDDTDLDLSVHDENGNLIGFSDGPYDMECVDWTPRWTGSFRIRVKNLGYVYNVYEFATN